MSINKGKIFEKKFRADWLQSMPDSSIDRLYDSVSGYRAISNVSDFICYKYPHIFYLECKSHSGNTFPFTALTQYDALSAKVGITGVRAGMVLYMYDHDVVLYVPISTVTKMKADGLKSVNVKMLGTESYANYVIYEIPSKKKRVYMDSDYSILMATKEGE